MLKEEVLEKSRSERTDEGMENAENQGRRIGFIAFVFVFLALALFNLFVGETGTFYAMLSLFWVFLAAEAYAKYRFAKRKVYLVTVISGSIASLGFLANHILVVLG